MVHSLDAVCARGADGGQPIARGGLENRHRVIPSGAQRVATRETPRGKSASPEHTEAANRLGRIISARGQEPAGSGKYRRNKELVSSDARQGEAGRQIRHGRAWHDASECHENQSLSPRTTRRAAAHGESPQYRNRDPIGWTSPRHGRQTLTDRASRCSDERPLESIA
jgi:hypothetical protein